MIRTARRLFQAPWRGAVLLLLCCGPLRAEGLKVAVIPCEFGGGLETLAELVEEQFAVHDAIVVRPSSIAAPEHGMSVMALPQACGIEGSADRVVVVDRMGDQAVALMMDASVGILMSLVRVSCDGGMSAAARDLVATLYRKGMGSAEPNDDVRAMVLPVVATGPGVDVDQSTRFLEYACAESILTNTGMRPVLARWLWISAHDTQADTRPDVGSRWVTVAGVCSPMRRNGIPVVRWVLQVVPTDTPSARPSVSGYLSRDMLDGSIDFPTQDVGDWFAQLSQQGSCVAAVELMSAADRATGSKLRGVAWSLHCAADLVSEGQFGGQEREMTAASEARAGRGTLNGQAANRAVVRALCFAGRSYLESRAATVVDWYRVHPGSYPDDGVFSPKEFCVMNENRRADLLRVVLKARMAFWQWRAAHRGGVGLCRTGYYNDLECVSTAWRLEPEIVTAEAAGVTHAYLDADSVLHMREEDRDVNAPLALHVARFTNYTTRDRMNAFIACLASRREPEYVALAAETRWAVDVVSTQTSPTAYAASARRLLTEGACFSPLLHDYLANRSINNHLNAVSELARGLWPRSDKERRRALEDELRRYLGSHAERPLPETLTCFLGASQCWDLKRALEDALPADPAPQPKAPPRKRAAPRPVARPRQLPKSQVAPIKPISKESP